MANSTGPKIISDRIILIVDPLNVKSVTTESRNFNSLSPNKSDLIATNGLTWSSDQINNHGFNFGLTSSNITTKSTLDFPSAFTVNAWVNLPTTGGQKTILSDGGQTLSGYFWMLCTNDQLELYFTEGFGNNVASSPTFFTGLINQWINLCVVVDYNSSSVNFYRNGTFVSSDTLFGFGNAKALAPASGKKKIIGNETDPPNLNDYYLTGRVGHLTVYSRLLTATEVLQNYRALRKRYNV